CRVVATSVLACPLGSRQARTLVATTWRAQAAAAKGEAEAILPLLQGGEECRQKRRTPDRDQRPGLGSQEEEQRAVNKALHVRQPGDVGRGAQQWAEGKPLGPAEIRGVVVKADGQTAGASPRRSRRRRDGPVRPTPTDRRPTAEQVADPRRHAALELAAQSG